MTFASAPTYTPGQPQLAGTTASQGALLLGCWAIIACATLVADFGRLPDGLSNDDAMRLVAVRDLLAGQSWFDLTQHRLGSSGLLMHWSRLIDLPIAFLLKFFQLFTDAPLAERLTMAVWPLLVLLPMLAGMRALGSALAGAPAGNLALVLGMLLVPLIGHYRPGALDHHNVQIALLLWAAAWTVRFTPRDAALSASAMALSLAVGLEMLPAIAVLAASAGARWIAQGEHCKRASIAFGLIFAAATFALMIATVPSVRWFVVACDAMSGAHLSAAFVGGVGLAVLAATASERSIAVRLAGAAGLGACALATVVVIAPDCLAGPYSGVHPRLQAFWLANVAETQSLLATLAGEPVEAIALYIPPLAALLLAAFATVRARGDATWPWATAAALQLILLAVASWEFRGTAIANAVAAALVAAALVRLVSLRKEAPLVFGLRRAVLTSALVLTPLLLATSGNAIARAARSATAAAQPDQPSSRALCRDVSSYSMLAMLPKGRVLTFIDSGAFVLMQTRHSVLAAPYHRNNEGNLAAIDTLLASPAEALTKLKQNGIDYVVMCNGAPELGLYQHAKDGLAAQLAQGRVPDFLQQVTCSDGPVRAYRVVR
jgi:hypothetical protein